MPEKLEVWSCKFCGAEFHSVLQAENCEKSHLHIADLKLGVIATPGNDKFCYEPRSIWPDFLRISCTTKSIDGAVYQLVGTSKKLMSPEGQG